MALGLVSNPRFGHKYLSDKSKELEPSRHLNSKHKHFGVSFDVTTNNIVTGRRAEMVAVSLFN